ncbi:transposase [Caballeronia humi]|uniref:Mutator family transposase n=1 Tax=Caballeronia humi TaxID=326474 RepID=A0A158J7Y2_9BURK|nr:transposase [Caballeronia humi]
MAKRVPRAVPTIATGAAASACLPTTTRSIWTFHRIVTARSDPVLIARGEQRFTGFDSKIIAMYARGMTVREIQGFLLEMYALEVSPHFISTVADSVMDEVREWQQRPLEAMYLVVFFNALRVEIRDEGVVRNKAIYLALGVRRDGTPEVLGLWIEQTERAKFWLGVVNDLKLRGVQDILIAVVDGLKGFPAAINAVFPETTTQTCIVHLIRNSLDRRALATRLGAGYSVLCVRTRNPQNRLHDQRDRVAAHATAQDHQGAWPLSRLTRRCKWTGSRHDWESAMTQFALRYPERFNIGL